MQLFHYKIFLKEINIYQVRSNDCRCLESRCGRPSQDLLIFVFFFLLFLCRSFAFLTCDIGILASGTPIIISSSSNATAPSAFEAILRREGNYLDENHRPRPARRSTRSCRVRNDIANETGRREVTPCRQVLALRTGR